MEILSTHTSDDYLYELKGNLGSSTDFGIERFTGLIVGCFFCITHHCSYEWENKHSCQKNTAIGIVQNSTEGCTVKYFTTVGELRPQMLVPVYLISIVTSLVFVGNISLAAYVIGIYTFMVILDAVIEPMTQASKDGKRSLHALLADPRNPYNNL